MYGVYWNGQAGGQKRYNGPDINKTQFHDSNNRKQDAITDPAADYDCDM
jgi:hypothetical protein